MICQVIPKLAVLNVTMDVEGGDELLEVCELTHKIREVLSETFAKVYSVLTPNIVTVEYIPDFWMLSQCHH